jgi:cell wall-active antibiotic response 4TMS protein YvqF
MSDRIRCGCRRCTIRGLMWPAIIITIGLLFLLSEMHRGNFDLGNTYPVILIVIGAISLAAALAPMDGHIDGRGLPGVPPGAPGSTSTPSQNPFPGPGQGQ